MTSVDGASRAQPPRTPPSSAQANPNDIGAMRDALAAAKGKMEKPAGQAGKKQLAQAPRGRDGVPLAVGRENATPRLQSQREGTEALAGWNGQGAALAPVMVPADATAPHIDPSAFAQMLADLWTRENGRGSKEIRVRFGDRAWPATGARLVRNAAGTLDVALFVGDGGRAYGDKLAGLEGALTDAGVDLGSLAIENDAG